jgi:hypothetical protein
MVRSAKEPGAIREAMLRGKFYVSSGLTFSRLEMSPTHVHVTIEPRAGEDTEVRFMGAGGKVLATVQGTDACYPVAGHERYVRVAVRSDGGARAWSQPLWLAGEPLARAEATVAKGRVEAP